MVPLAGTVEETGDPFEPFRMLDAVGERVVPVAKFLFDLQACGRSEATQRWYSLALLRWFRFLWAVEVPWDQATRTEARDLVRPGGSGDRYICELLASLPDSSVSIHGCVQNAKEELM
jgi:hypothetical protein